MSESKLRAFLGGRSLPLFLIVSCIGDYLTTDYALASGLGAEANGLLTGFSVLVILAASKIGIIAGGLLSAKAGARGGRWVLVALAVWQFVVMANNVAVLK